MTTLLVSAPSAALATIAPSAPVTSTRDAFVAIACARHTPLVALSFLASLRDAGSCFVTTGDGMVHAIIDPTSRKSDEAFAIALFSGGGYSFSEPHGAQLDAARRRAIATVAPDTSVEVTYPAVDAGQGLDSRLAHASWCLETTRAALSVAINRRDMAEQVSSPDSTMWRHSCNLHAEAFSLALKDYDRAMSAVRNDRVAPLDAAARLRGAVVDFAAACLANDVALAGQIATTIAYGQAITNEASAEDIANRLADMASECFDMSDETSREEYFTLEAVVTTAVVQACKLITLTA